MGHARGSAAIPARNTLAPTPPAQPAPAVTTGPERRGHLSVVRGGAEPPRWVPTTLERLVGALDLRQTGPRQFEAAAAEAQWPAFPGALLLASAVVAAERSFPGYAVGHLSGSFGQPARAQYPVEVALCEVHSGESCVTGRITFRQRATVHGEVAVVLRSASTVLPGDPGPRCARPARPPVPAPAAAGEPRLPVPLVPWDLVSVPGAARPSPGRPRAVPAPAPGACCPAGCSQTWTRIPGAPRGGTLQRALLAYLSELLPMASAAAVPYPSAAGKGGLSATVLSHAITYGARFDVRDWLLAAVEGPAAGEGYVHALATFRTRRGAVAATVSQAAAVWDRGRPPGVAGHSRPARRLVLSG